MTPETIESIKQTLAPVAEKLGQGAEYGWEVLVWGQFAEGVANLVITAVLVITSVILFKKAFSILKENETLGYHDRSELHIPMLIVGSILSIISILALYDGVIGTIAPEYAAIKFLISAGK